MAPTDRTPTRPFRVDLHCHTSASFDSRADPRSMARAALAAGLTHLAVTDHDTLEAALRLRDAAPAGLTVIVGCEVHTTGGDLVAVFLERPVPAGLPVAETIDAVHAQGGLVGVPHPFDRSRRSLLRDPALADVLRAADWVEIHNARVSREADNAQAAALAKRIGLPGAAVSDAHTSMEAGAAWTALAIAPDTASALLVALRDGRPVTSGGADAGDAHGPAGGGAVGRLVGRLRRSG